MEFEKDTTSYGIISAVLGGLAMFAWLIPIVGIVLSGSAILTGTKAVNNEEDGWPLAGIVLGVASFIMAFMRSGLVYIYG